MKYLLLLCVAVVLGQFGTAAEQPCKNGKCANVRTVSSVPISGCVQCSSVPSGTIGTLQGASSVQTVVADSGRVLIKTTYANGSVGYRYADGSTESLPGSFGANQVVPQPQIFPAFQPSGTCPNGQCPKVKPQGLRFLQSRSNSGTGDAEGHFNDSVANRVLGVGCNLDAQENRLLSMVNLIRAEAGFSPLVVDSTLQERCRSHAALMAGSRGANHSYDNVFENVGFAYGYADNDSVAVQSWKKSKGHYSNMLQGSVAGIASVNGKYILQVR